MMVTYSVYCDKVGHIYFEQVERAAGVGAVHPLWYCVPLFQEGGAAPPLHICHPSTL